MVFEAHRQHPKKSTCCLVFICTPEPKILKITENQSGPPCAFCRIGVPASEFGQSSVVLSAVSPCLPVDISSFDVLCDVTNCVTYHQSPPAMASRPGSLQVPENGVAPHDFKLVHFSTLTWCSFCTKFIWYDYSLSLCLTEFPKGARKARIPMPRYTTSIAVRNM